MALLKWLDGAEQHALNNPAPTELGGVSIFSKSTPRQEQDVIAMFHELVAGGLFKGYRFLGSFSNDPYDSIFEFDYGADQIAFDQNDQTLGVNPGYLEGANTLRRQVLEYKKSFDGLIEDFDNKDKSPNAVNLVVCWDLGTKYKDVDVFRLSSYLDGNNGTARRFHGATHKLTYGQATFFEIISLSDLIEHLENS